MMSYYRVTVEPLGREIPCRSDQSILDACLREGIWLPHACTHGTCGTCKAQILEGEVDHRDSSPYALLDFERDDRYALLCTARPRSDLVVEGDVDLEEGIAVHPVGDFTGTVTAIEDASPGVRRLRVDLDRPMSFNPGQYAVFTLPDGETRRSYSIASSPSQPDSLEFHVKLTTGGRCSEGWVFSSLSTGDRMALTGPYGRFSLRPARQEPMLLLAGGTGLAPIASMIRHIAETGLPRQMTLYHGVRTRADLYEHAWLSDLAGSLPGFRYQPALSRDTWEGRSGHVSDLVAEDHPRAAGNVAYVCGPPVMVEQTLKALMKRRLFPRDIYREDFFDTADKVRGVTVRSPLLKR